MNAITSRTNIQPPPRAHPAWSPRAGVMSLSGRTRMPTEVGERSLGPQVAPGDTLELVGHGLAQRVIAMKLGLAPSTA